MFVLYRLCAAMPPTARVVCRNKAAASGGPPLREAAVREVRCPGGPLSGRSLSGRSAALSGQADINVCFLGCDAQWEVAFAFFARDMDPRTACFARLRGAGSAPLNVPLPGLRYACLGLEKGRLFEATAAHGRVWPLRPLRFCERYGCAHCATVRLRGTEYSSFPVPPQTAVLPRLSLGLSMSPPLRGCRGAVLCVLCGFVRDMGMRTACFARLRGAESAPLNVLRPGLRYACPELEKGRLFEAIAAHSRVWPLRSLREIWVCALRATVRLRGSEYSSFPVPPQTAVLPRLSLGLSMIQPLRGYCGAQSFAFFARDKDVRTSSRLQGRSCWQMPTNLSTNANQLVDKCRPTC